MENNKFQSAFEQFKENYESQLNKHNSEQIINAEESNNEFFIKSSLLKPGNYPSIIHHGEFTKDAIVLVHGLTDSPYYMRAIGERFFAEGLNVVLPLLPAHGLKDPDKAMENKKLDSMWKAELDSAVDIAHRLGERVSLGGFSTGGALSYNKILRDPESVKGCLFLFSAALELGFIDELADVPLLQTFLRLKDGTYIGEGPNPYKYPTMSRFAGMELAQIIEENEDLEAGKIISQPVFAAHSIHDNTVKIEGILQLMKKHVKHGYTFIISKNLKTGDKRQNVRHEEVVLDKNIKLDNLSIKQPEANPMFDWMIDDVIRFFRKYC